MSWLSNLWSSFTTELKVLGTLFSADVWPYIKSTVMFFLTDEGKIILASAIKAAPTLASNFSAAVSEVAADAIAAAPAIIAQDATQTLNQIQTALQLVKNTQGIVAPNDTASLQAVQTAQSAASGNGASTSEAASSEQSQTGANSSTAENAAGTSEQSSSPNGANPDTTNGGDGADSTQQPA